MAGPSYPVFYYRTFATRSQLVPFQDINGLLQNAPLQCLKFDDTTAMIEAVQKTFEKNNTDDPQFNADGIMGVNKQQNGMLGQTIVITGHMDTIAGFPKQQILESFATLNDIETQYHKWGIFGLWFPDAPIYTQDPINEPTNNPPSLLGYTISKLQWNFAGAKGSLLPFTLILRFGGRRV